mmetsp:Transcript_40971/g.91630  ORF Transcript_40971/g.91630 Transcript_40971/m.91630 type:complete len:413 (-) Transcript_40971:26-1264(-)
MVEIGLYRSPQRGAGRVVRCRRTFSSEEDRPGLRIVLGLCSKSPRSGRSGEGILGLGLHWAVFDRVGDNLARGLVQLDHRHDFVFRWHGHWEPEELASFDWGNAIGVDNVVPWVVAVSLHLAVVVIAPVVVVAPVVSMHLAVVVMAPVVEVVPMVSEQHEVPMPLAVAVVVRAIHPALQAWAGILQFVAVRVPGARSTKREGDQERHQRHETAEAQGTCSHRGGAGGGISAGMAKAILTGLAEVSQGHPRPSDEGDEQADARDAAASREAQAENDPAALRRMPVSLQSIHHRRLRQQCLAGLDHGRLRHGGLGGRGRGRCGCCRRGCAGDRHGQKSSRLDLLLHRGADTLPIRHGEVDLLARHCPGGHGDLHQGRRLANHFRLLRAGNLCGRGRCGLTFRKQHGSKLLCVSG